MNDDIPPGFEAVELCGLDGRVVESVLIVVGDNPAIIERSGRYYVARPHWAPDRAYGEARVYHAGVGLRRRPMPGDYPGTEGGGA